MSAKRRVQQFRNAMVTIAVTILGAAYGLRSITKNEFLLYGAVIFFTLLIVFCAVFYGVTEMRKIADTYDPATTEEISKRQMIREAFKLDSVGKIAALLLIFAYLTLIFTPISK